MKKNRLLDVLEIRILRLEDECEDFHVNFDNARTNVNNENSLKEVSNKEEIIHFKNINNYFFFF